MKIKKEGIFAIYKPKGPTSHDIINQLRRLTGIRKIGHAGTLDPLAKGVLIVGIGREATKKLSTIVKGEKEYVAVIKLGSTSSTDDEEGEKTSVWSRAYPKPSLKNIKPTLKKFTGNIKQIPPIYSAIKIKGKTAYSLARKGKPPELSPRPVFIKKISLISYKWPLLKIKVLTGPGVYIRSLARDIGSKLKTGGYLKSLERTRVGEFTKNKAIKNIHIPVHIFF